MPDQSNVLDILVKDIDRKLHELDRGYYREEQRVIPEKQWPAKVKSLLAKWHDNAKEISKLQKQQAALIDKANKACKSGTMVTQWGDPKVRETEGAARNRIQGNTAKRAKQRERLREIRASVIAVAAQNGDLASWVLDFNREFPATGRED